MEPGLETVTLPPKLSGSTETTVSPATSCSQDKKANAAVNSKVADTPCVQKSNCLVSTTLKDCGTTQRRRSSADKGSTLIITNALYMTASDGSNTSTFMMEVVDDARNTFNTLVSDPYLTINGVTNAVDMSNTAVKGVVECALGTMQTLEDNHCVPCERVHTMMQAMGFVSIVPKDRTRS